MKSRWTVDRYTNFNDIRNSDDYDCIFIESSVTDTIKATQKGHPNIITRLLGVDTYESKLHHIPWADIRYLLALSQHQINYFKSFWGERRCVAQNYGVLPQIALLDKFPLRDREANTQVALVANITGRKGVDQIPEFLLRYPHLHIHHLGKVCLYGNPAMDFVRWRTKRDGTEDRYHYLKIIPPNQMGGWYQQLSHIWLPSIQEGFNRSLLEGMCCGLKPIIRHWAGAEDIWPQEALYDRLEEIDKILKIPFTPKKYRQYVEDRYSPEIILDKLETFLS